MIGGVVFLGVLELEESVGFVVSTFTSSVFV